MEKEKIIEQILNNYLDLKVDNNWGEKAIFYNPEDIFAKGAYMLTFKENDGKNDSASFLNREGIYRLNLKISHKSFIDLFKYIPNRPKAGEVVDTKHDFTKINELMPHPVYGWMTWVCVLNPTNETVEMLFKEGLIEDAYQAAIKNIEKRTKSRIKLIRK
jgi:hypothetical protein